MRLAPAGSSLLSARTRPFSLSAFVEPPAKSLSAPPHVKARLDELRQMAKENTAVHLGYPYNLNCAYSDLQPFLEFFLNNLGDAYAGSNYGINTQEMEREVIDMFTQMWSGPTGSVDHPIWGAVTSCGTEGNLLGILYGREALKSVPTVPTLVSSVESHYSVAKAARMYGMRYERVRSTDEDGEIDYDELTATARKIVHEQNGGVCAVINVGSTVKGAHDKLVDVIAALDAANVPPERRYLHCDAALSGLILPLVAEARPYHFGFDLGADSIAVSGHKQLGTPIPCGVVCTRREHMERWAAGTPAEADYVNTQDSTIAGSRSGFAALALWYVLETKGRAGLEADARYCMGAASSLRDAMLEASPGCGATCSPFSTTVVFERPSEHIEQRFQLATTGEIAHVVVTPSVTADVLGRFIEEYTADRAARGA